MNIWGIFNKTIMPIALVGYRIIIANSARLSFRIPNVRPWNNRLLTMTSHQFVKTSAGATDEISF